ncbi:MAG: PIN domain-containing protein [Caldilineaceae bacterium]
MLTVDANVWIAANDRGDTQMERSRDFLAAATRQQETIFLPSFAQVEIACALARRRRSPEIGQRLANQIMALSHIVAVPLDSALVTQSVQTGTRLLLRSADALYAAVAAMHSAQLVSWDAELIQRAGAITPADWLATREP